MARMGPRAGVPIMTCDSKLNLSGNCNRCRNTAELHFVENILGSLNPELLCAKCCPVHRTAPAVEWLQPEPVTITGTQEALF
jgi:hypothetical protein